MAASNSLSLRFRLPDRQCISFEVDLSNSVAEIIENLVKAGYLDAKNPHAMWVPPRDQTTLGWWLKGADHLKTMSLKKDEIIEVKYVPKSAFFSVGELSDAWVQAFDPSMGRSAFEEMLVDYSDPLVETVSLLARMLKVKKGEEYIFHHLEINERGIKHLVPLNCNLSLDDQDVSPSSPYILLVPAASLMKINAETVKSPAASGYLTKVSVKQGKITSPVKRWCLLIDNYLLYYKNQAGPPSGFVLLEHYSLCLDKSAGKNQFELAYTGMGFCHFRPNFIFNTDNNPDLDRWSSAIRSRCVDGAGKTTFGVPLSKLLKRNRLPATSIPHIVRDTVMALTPSLDEEGIFRKSGSALLVAQCRSEYDSGRSPDLSTNRDPHAIAGLLKLWLRELPEPLLTFELFQPFLDTLGLATPAAKIEATKKLLKRLPQENLTLIEFLLPFLRTVSDKSASNLMTASNLATVFGPNLLSPRDNSAQNMMHFTVPINQFVEFIIQNSAQLVNSGSSVPGPSSPAWGLGSRSTGFNRIQNMGLGATRVLHGSDSDPISPRKVNNAPAPIAPRLSTDRLSSPASPAKLPTDRMPSPPTLSSPSTGGAVPPPGSGFPPPLPVSAVPPVRPLRNSGVVATSPEDRVATLASRLQEEIDARRRLEDIVMKLCSHLQIDPSTL
ncbi:MAG: hypothetical protein Q8P67_22540 [archaeon]|nr:hypothetical protein [archaeon]